VEFAVAVASNSIPSRGEKTITANYAPRQWRGREKDQHGDHGARETAEEERR